MSPVGWPGSVGDMTKPTPPTPSEVGWDDLAAILTNALDTLHAEDMRKKKKK